MSERQEWDVTSTQLKGNYELFYGVWFGLTLHQLSHQASWAELACAQAVQGRPEGAHAPLISTAVPWGAQSKGREGAREQEVGRAGRGKGKGKQHTALCCRAWEGNWVGNTPREGFRGRTKNRLHCGEEIEVFSNVTLRLVQLVPAFVSTHGRRHCTVLDLALYSCPPQHPSYLGWQRISH